MQATSPHERNAPEPPDATSGPADVQPELPPLPDPYLWPRATGPSTRVHLSGLAITASVAWIFLGPLGAVASIVFGWAARRQIDRSEGTTTGRGLANLGLVAGVLATVAWGAALSLLIFRHRMDPPPPPPIAFVTEPPSLPRAAPQAPARPNEPPPGGSVPRETTTKHEGKITVVDIGVEASTLERALAKQRAQASAAGEKVLVMLTTDRCEPCRGVDASLRTPLMQTALAKVRLVRVDIDVFKDDLDALKMPHERYPAFFLLNVDLTPKDGIDGGEWDEDVAENIAPVLGAFVRGRYTTRRDPWRPLPGSGVQL
jgi:hypothetical protein